MENGIQRFEFEGRAVRVNTEQEEPRFNASDVCDALDISNHRDALSRLEEDEKGVASTDTPGGAQEAQHVTLPGVYRLVLTSRKPEARKFQRWVLHDVLPAIQRAGSYSVAPAALDLTDPASLQRLALQLTGLVQEQTKALAEAKPKVEFFDRFTGSGGHLGLMECAKALRLPERKWCAWAVSSGYLFRNGDGVLLPYAKYGPQGSGLFEVRTWTVNEIVRVQAFVTPKGYQHFAANLPQLDTRRRRLPPAQHSMPQFGGQP